MKEFSDKELLFDYKLSNLIRYNHRPKINNESVAQHSYFVILYSLKLCNYFNFDSETTNNILIKATLHDLPEIEISDIPYDVKQVMPEIKQLIKNAESNFYKKRYDAYFDIIFNNVKIEDLIVEYADALSVLQYCLSELTLCPHNNDFLIIKEETIIRLDNLKKEIEKYAKK